MAHHISVGVVVKNERRHVCAGRVTRSINDVNARSLCTWLQVFDRDAGLPDAIGVREDIEAVLSDGQCHGSARLGRLAQCEQNAGGSLCAENAVCAVGILECTLNRSDGIALGHHGFGVEREAQSGWIGLQRQSGVISTNL